jgi:hypothetical protein
MIMLPHNSMVRCTKSTRSWFAAGLVAAVALAGCGGSSSLSHAKLDARANAACRQADEAAARLGEPGSGYAGLARYANRLSPIVQRLTSTLGALEANANDRPALDHYLRALRAGDHALVMLAGASSPAQLAQATSLLSSQSIPALADALGAPSCGVSVSSV